MKRYFEFSDSKSYKFWQIEVEDAVCTVRYGKIGTDGQEKQTTHACAELAQKEAAKLITEKTRKGYVEKEEAGERKVSRRISVDYEEAEEGKTLLEKVKAFVDSPQAAQTEALVIGCWEEAYESDCQAALDHLCASSAKLPCLRELFVGDMDSEDCEISWINQGNYTGVLAAFPDLERLHIKGSTGLVLCDAPMQHASLKALTIECGGLPARIVQTIAQAQLPALEYLNLYLGEENYGFDGSLDDVRPFMGRELFPKLKYLALCDSIIADEIAEAIAEAPVLDILETLDLSQSVLTDRGGQALLDSSKVRGLKRLDLHYHYMGNEMMGKLRVMGPIVDVSDQQDSDDEWRYPAVTE